MTSSAKPLLIESLDYAFNRLLHRLDGLTDDEYFWEPVAGCWSVRSNGDGTFRWDYEWPNPDPHPVTTIAWRLTHIAGMGTGPDGAKGLADNRNRAWLGLEPPAPAQPVVIPGTAKEAIAAIEDRQAKFHADLEAVTEEQLWDAIGPVGGGYADASRVAWVIHMFDEVVHHGAEVGVLRDLYRARFAVFS